MNLLLLASIVACNNDIDDSICNTTDPETQLGWLKEEIVKRKADTIDITKYFYISQATYNSQTVFVYNDCCPICNTSIYVYNCFGDRIGQVHDDIKWEDIKNSKIIFKPQNFACE